MKKLLNTAAALAVAVSTLSYLAGQAQAAPAKNPFCNLPPAATIASWAEAYGCWGAPPRTQFQPAPSQTAYTGPGQTDFCKLPAAINASWAEYYGCWRPHR